MITEYKPNTIQIDLTNRCNAACLFCARTTNPEEVGSDKNITVDDMKKILKSDITRIIMNGTYGDASVNPHIFDIIEYIKTTQCEEIILSTNGSAHTEQWWTRLGNVMRPDDKVIFALDGNTAKSHEAYRKKTSFDKVLKHAQCYINTGGWAIWQFILFDYNVDELEGAKKRAQDMGFLSFRTIYSQRNFNYKNATHKIGNKFYTKIDPICITRQRSYLTMNGDVTLCCWTSTKDKEKGIMPNIADYDSLEELYASNEWAEYYKLYTDHWKSVEGKLNVKEDTSEFPCTKYCGLKKRNIKETINFTDRIFVEHVDESSTPIKSIL